MSSRLLPTTRLGIRIGSVAILALAALSRGCALNGPVCTGEYDLNVRYENTDVNDVHLWVGEGTTNAENKVVSGTFRELSYEGWFYGAVYEESQDATNLACLQSEAQARTQPHTWTFFAGRAGTVIATTTLIVNYDDLRERPEETDSKKAFDVLVRWDGVALTATKR